MGGLVVALGEEHKIHRVGGEAKAIAELLDRHADIHHANALRHRIGQIEIDQVGQRYGERHRPDPSLQSAVRNGHATQHTAQ